MSFTGNAAFVHIIGGLRFIAGGEEDCKTTSNDEDGSDHVCRGWGL
jgi:hypothetical protein